MHETNLHVIIKGNKKICVLNFGLPKNLSFYLHLDKREENLYEEDKSLEVSNAWA